jgi:hypothetical protein
MPGATQALQDKWGDDGKALEYLTERGWTIRGNGLLCRPTDRPRSEIGEDEWSAVDYLHDEWDYDYIPHPDE